MGEVLLLLFLSWVEYILSAIIESLSFSVILGDLIFGFPLPLWTLYLFSRRLEFSHYSNSLLYNLKERKYIKERKGYSLNATTG